MNNCMMCWTFIVFENIPEIPCQICHMLLGSSSLQWVHAGKTPVKIWSFGKQQLPEGGIPTTTLPVSMGSVIVTMGSWHTHTQRPSPVFPRKTILLQKDDIHSATAKQACTKYTHYSSTEDLKPFIMQLLVVFFPYLKVNSDDNRISCCRAP